MRRNTAAPRPAKSELNLPEYDKHELQLQRDLLAKAKECAVSAKLAKGEMAKLARQKAKLSKKDPAYLVFSDEIDQKILAYKGIAAQKCSFHQPICGPSNDAKKVVTPKSMGEELNRSHGTKVDFERLSKVEGGEHTVAYVPWWVYLKNDKPHIVFYENSLSKNIPRLAGANRGRPGNRSGVTVGIGVDLGQDSAKNFLQKMKNRNTGSQKISEDDLLRLHEKITPYFQKIGGEACQFLRENPLVLTPDETHFLNKVSHGELLEKAMKDYSSVAIKKGAKKFTELSMEQQTALLLDGYQRGTVDEGLINAVIRGNSRAVSAALNRK